jgi:hypothetical protein
MSTFSITSPVNIDSLPKIGTKTAGWTRVTTTATITLVNHGMITNDVIFVTNTSDVTAITLSAKTITRLSNDTFSFTCLNAGAASGTITFTATDNYNINGGILTIDQDSRYGLNQDVASSLNNITLSATLGGSVEIDARNVRLIPYNAGSGILPELNTVISGGTNNLATGKLIGVWSNIASGATISGATIPASGLIKIKEWNGVPFTIGALSNITASAISGDTVGWIEIVGNEFGTATVNRLNTFRMRGDWFSVGTTNGTRATIYQLPTSGSLMYLPGVWVETNVASDNYEFYPCAGTLTATAANIATDRLRGKFCWITANGGLLRFGHDGTNSTGGYIPPSGLRIRIPNIITQNCVIGFKNVNVLPSVTLATRYDFTTTGGGVIEIDKAALNWYPSFAQPYSVNISNTSIATQLLVSEIAAPLTWDNVGVGQEAANAQLGLSMATCFAGGTISNSRFTSATLASSGRYVGSFSDLDGFTFNNTEFIGMVARGNATTGAMTLTRVNNSIFNNSVLGDGRALLTTCSNIDFNNTIYYDHPSTTTNSTNPMYVYDLASSCVDIKMDGLSFSGLTLTQPYSGILNVGAAGCTNIKLRNIGTYEQPLDLGAPKRENVAWARTTTTATVTAVTHGLKVNDIIYVTNATDVSAIAVGAKTIASIPTANIFTFTATNAGSTSGSLSYYPTMSALLFALAGGAAANTVEIKRCYIPHTRTNIYTADNSSKNIELKNVFGDYNINVPLTPQLNGSQNGIGGRYSLAAQTSTYGTHWIDYFIAPPTPSATTVTWTRSTTTATVYSPSHNLVTSDLINVTTSSDISAIILGNKTLSVLSASTFTFTCLNAGATSGTLSFVPHNGRIGLVMNESTSDTVDQYNIDNGTPGFTSAGSLFMPTLGQQITFTSPEYILGHKSFPIVEPTIAGGLLNNHHVLYALDKNNGSGFEPFYNLYYTVSANTGSNGSTNVIVRSTSGITVGDYVFGTNIAPNAYVTGITDSTTFVVDKPNVGVVSGLLRFNHLPSETNIDPSLGFKMKVRITTTSGNTNAISSLYVPTFSDYTSRSYQYQLDPQITITLTGLVNPTEVRVFSASTTTEIAGQETITSGQFSFDVASGTLIDISILSLQYQNLRLKNYNVTSDATIPIQQIVDRQYLNS